MSITIDIREREGSGCSELHALLVKTWCLGSAHRHWLRAQDIRELDSSIVYTQRSAPTTSILELRVKEDGASGGAVDLSADRSAALLRS